MRDVALGAILLGAAALRLYGIDHGLPFVYNPDEANLMARALSVARSLDPGYYLYPSFFFYFLFGVMGALFVTGRLFGRYESLEAFQARFFEDPSDFYLAGRLVGVLLALGTVALTYRLAAKHLGRGAARASALFVAVCYFHVRDSHYLKHDVPAGFLVALSLWAMDRAFERKDKRSYLLAGAVLGVSFATHYYMIFLAPAFLVCHVVHRRLEAWRDVLYAGLASALTFFLLSPFVILRFTTALEHMRANRQIVVDRSLDAGAALFPSLGPYAHFLATQGFGFLLVLLTVTGYVVLAVRKPKALALYGVFPALFVAFIGYTFFAGRYLNPILPCLAIAAGAGVTVLGKRWSAVVALAACLQPLHYGLQVDRLFAGEDTRTLARRWILDHVDPEKTLALQSYSVPLPQTAESFRESIEANGALAELSRGGKYAGLLEVAEKNRKAYRLVYLGNGEELDRIYVGYRDLRAGLEPLENLQVDAVVLREPPTGPPPEVAALFERVRKEGALLKTISPFAGEASGPPYIDNEDWPPRGALLHKGPLIEIWSLEE